MRSRDVCCVRPASAFAPAFCPRKQGWRVTRTSISDAELLHCTPSMPRCMPRSRTISASFGPTTKKKTSTTRDIPSFWHGQSVKRISPKPSSNPLSRLYVHLALVHGRRSHGLTQLKKAERHPVHVEKGNYRTFHKKRNILQQIVIFAPMVYLTTES